jgi:hypothetical protein
MESLRHYSPLSRIALNFTQTLMQAKGANREKDADDMKA